MLAFDGDLGGEVIGTARRAVELEFVYLHGQRLLAVAAHTDHDRPTHLAGRDRRRGDFGAIHEQLQLTVRDGDGEVQPLRSDDRRTAGNSHLIEARHQPLAHQFDTESVPAVDAINNKAVCHRQAVELDPHTGRPALIRQHAQLRGVRHRDPFVAR